MLLEDNLSSFKDKLAIGKHLTIDLHKISIRCFQEVYWCFSFSFFFGGGCMFRNIITLDTILLSKTLTWDAPSVITIRTSLTPCLSLISNSPVRTRSRPFPVYVLFDGYEILSIASIIEFESKYFSKLNTTSAVLEKSTTPTCEPSSAMLKDWTKFLRNLKHFLKFPFPILPEPSNKKAISTLAWHS